MAHTRKKIGNHWYEVDGKGNHSLPKSKKRTPKKIDNRGKKIGVLGGHSIFAISDKDGLY